MILDHDYAKRFQIHYSLFQHVDKRNVTVLKRHSMDYVKRFIRAEQMKTLFLINYAYFSADVRKLFYRHKLLDKELILVNGKLVFEQEESQI